ncbi:hypothetical protein RM96_07530 [Cupriavidus sp. IDO]|jgi:hypothetical protein|nr:hypothetical protein RM96_07530 [Cupriavidus sp. IDO]
MMDLSSFRPLDPGRINLMDPIEVQYWCRELACTEDDLEKAVDQAGDHIAAVRAQLEGASPLGQSPRPG